MGVQAWVHTTRWHRRWLRVALQTTILLAAALPGFAVTLRQQNFEVPSDGTNYVVVGERGTNSAAVDTYFKRGPAANFNMLNALTGLHGANFWGGEDTDASDGSPPTTITLPSTDIRGFQNLRATWALAASRDAVGTYEGADFMQLEIALDGGDWTNLTAFRGPLVGAGFLRADADGDGGGEATALTRTFADFQHNISGLGTGLQVRAVMFMSATTEEAAYDDIRITGDAIVPSISITNPPVDIAILDAITTYDVEGFANLGVVGDIAWTNTLTGQRGTIPAATNWSISAIPLAQGNNTITVLGSNTVGQSASDSVLIYRVPPPLLSITNPATDINVPDTVSVATLSGSANSVVTGLLKWTNSLNGASGTAAATSNWSIAGIGLAIGTNVITVTGTNIVQQSTNATVRIYRVPAPTIAITSPLNGAAVAHDAVGITLLGTASGEAFGLLRWTNNLTGDTGSTPASTNWTLASLPIALGTNQFTVTASNIVGQLASAVVSVYRVPAPTLAITVPAGNLAVPDTTPSINLAGTANGVVGGLLRWTNNLTGGTGTGIASTNWNLVGIPLALGTNTITVTGSNIVNRTASAVVSIYRVPAPTISITSPPNGFAVAHDVPGITLVGITSGEAFGLLRWTNNLTGDTGSGPASTNWTLASLPIALGTNQFTVTTSNIVGQLASAVVSVYRVPAPTLFITVPAGDVAVPSTSTTINLAGTANGVVSGLLRWTNSLTGGTGTGAASTNWNLAGIPLALGTNSITVTGSNIVGRTASAAVNVYRVPAPLISITNPPNGSAVADTVTAVTLMGTASGEAYGLLRWTNNLTGAAGSGAAAPNWNIPGVGLALGTNQIVVLTSNIVGQVATATTSVYRVPAPTLTITSPPPTSAVPDTTTTQNVSGTASGEIFGLLRWTNNLTGGTGTGAASTNWTLSGIPLALGTNTITVTGSNIVGRTASAAVSIYRVPAPVLTITDPATLVTVTNGVTARQVAGTANGVVTGLLTWSNALNGATGTTTAGTNWLIAAVSLVPGINAITVTGTNIVGRSASATAMIAREGTLLINEVYISSAYTNATPNLEYVELLNSIASSSATNLTLLQISGNFPDYGKVYSRWDLNGMMFGANGLLLLGYNYTALPRGGSWSNLVATHTGFGNFTFAPQNVQDVGTLLLVRNCSGSVAVGTDLDLDNNGLLDSTPWAESIDSVGWHLALNDEVYSPVDLGPQQVSEGYAEAATRFPSKRVPADPQAWYYGELRTNSTDLLERTYNPARTSTNTPAGAYLTPGRFNYPFANDQDGDQLPNSWEQQYFGNTTNATPSADPDGDGQSNQDEYWAGTDPTQSASVFVVDDMVSTGVITGSGATQEVLTVTGNVLSWASLSNRIYELYSTTNLIQPYVLKAGNIPATPPLNTYTASVNGVNVEFYRIGVTEPVIP